MRWAAWSSDGVRARRPARWTERGDGRRAAEGLRGGGRTRGLAGEVALDDGDVELDGGAGGEAGDGAARGGGVKGPEHGAARGVVEAVAGVRALGRGEALGDHVLEVEAEVS